MARGRLIDRDLFTHEGLGEIPPWGRLLFIGIVVHCDDDGRLKADPSYLKAKIFPYDTDWAADRICNMVRQLVGLGCLLVYQVETRFYFQVPKWEKWQPIRKDRYKPSDCPAPPKNISESEASEYWSTSGRPLVVKRKPLPNLTKPNLTKEKPPLPPLPGGKPEISSNVQISPPGPLEPQKRPGVSKHPQTAHAHPKAEASRPSRKRQATDKVELWQELIDHIHTKWVERKKAKPYFKPKDLKTLKALCRTYTTCGVMALWDKYWVDDDPFIKSKGHAIEWFDSRVPKLLDDYSWKNGMMKYEEKFFKPPDGIISNLAKTLGGKK